MSKENKFGSIFLPVEKAPKKGTPQQPQKTGSPNRKTRLLCLKPKRKKCFTESGFGY